MTARAPRRSQPPKARGGEGGTEHEHGQGKATNGGRTAGEAAQRTKASGAMAGRSTIGRRHPGQKRRRGPPSEASRQRRGRRGGHRAEPPKGKSGKGDNCTKQLYLVAKRTIALAIAPNAVFGATVGFTPPAEPPRRTRGGAAEPLTEKTRRVGRGVSSVGAPPERAMPGRRAMRGTARQSEQTPHRRRDQGQQLGCKLLDIVHYTFVGDLHEIGCKFAIQVRCSYLRCG